MKISGAICDIHDVHDAETIHNNDILKQFSDENLCLDVVSSKRR